VPHHARVLILFAHPAYEKSRVNVYMADAVRNLDGVTLHDLYEKYPDFFIDVEHEQELLLLHDVVVCQHPFYWYSTPAMVKQWEDLVLTHGWAYGSRGTRLRGKKWLHAITAGGHDDAYRPDGYNRHTFRQLMVPLEQTARLCGMDFLPPFIAAGTHGMTRDDMARYANDYRRVVEALRDGTLDLHAAGRWDRINGDLDSVIRSSVEAP
jgi:glutathione-regulated potassium-efflux system ancillary protein KefG